MQIALVFPGQGSQAVGMGQSLVASTAGQAFAEADEALGEPISQLISDGPADQLDLTVNAQPALVATSIAYLRAWLPRAAGAGLPDPAFYAGHSMGQYSAMVAAGVIDFADAVRLVRERGRLAQASAGHGAMAAIIGLDDDRLPDLEAAGQAVGVFAIANRNSPGQMVVSGERRAVEAATEAAKGLGARRAIMLPVSVAAHSPLMEGAAEGMRRALAEVRFRDPAAPILANADATPLTTADACRAELIEHLTRGVDWVGAVEAMTAAGVDTIVEVGPGRVLTNLVKRIAPSVTALATDDPTGPDGVLDPASLFITTTTE
jgi:[acyl-carrier-protein] S-malonyltransferase